MKNLNPLYEAVKILSQYYPKAGKLKSIIAPKSAKRMQLARDRVAREVRRKIGTPMGSGYVYSRHTSALDSVPL